MLVSVQAEETIFMAIFFVAVPAIAAAVGCAAWSGKPRNWDRSMYWTAFAASMVIAGFLIVGAQRIADTMPPRDSLALFGLGVVFFSVALGCGVGVFAYRRGQGPSWQKVSPRPEDPTDDMVSGHKLDE